MCLIYRGRSRAQTRMRQVSAIASADRISATRQDANRYTPRHPYSRATASVLWYTRKHISCRFWSAQAHENTKTKHSVAVIIITQSIWCNIHITYYSLFAFFLVSYFHSSAPLFRWENKYMNRGACRFRECGNSCIHFEKTEWEFFIKRWIDEFIDFEVVIPSPELLFRSTNSKINNRFVVSALFIKNLSDAISAFSAINV